MVPQHDYVSITFGDNPKEYEGIFQRQGVQTDQNYIQQQDPVISNSSDDAISKDLRSWAECVILQVYIKAVDKQSFSRWKRFCNKLKIIFARLRPRCESFTVKKVTPLLWRKVSVDCTWSWMRNWPTHVVLNCAHKCLNPSRDSQRTFINCWLLTKSFLSNPPTPPLNFSHPVTNLRMWHNKGKSYLQYSLLCHILSSLISFQLLIYFEENK